VCCGVDVGANVCIGEMSGEGVGVSLSGGARRGGDVVSGVSGGGTCGSARLVPEGKRL
jgi:hypothetical protein